MNAPLLVWVGPIRLFSLSCKSVGPFAPGKKKRRKKKEEEEAQAKQQGRQMSVMNISSERKSLFYVIYGYCIQRRMNQFITTVITTSFVIFYESGILKIKNGPWKHTYTLRAAPSGSARQTLHLHLYGSCSLSFSFCVYVVDVVFSPFFLSLFH